MRDHWSRRVASPTRSAADQQAIEQKARAYWKKNITFIVSLLTIWAVVSYGCGILLAERLSTITIGKLPLGFWFAHQGAIITFVILLLVYAIGMDRIDREFDVEE